MAICSSKYSLIVISSGIIILFSTHRNHPHVIDKISPPYREFKNTATKWVEQQHFGFKINIIIYVHDIVYVTAATESANLCCMSDDVQIYITPPLDPVLPQGQYSPGNLFHMLAYEKTFKALM